MSIKSKISAINTKTLNNYFLIVITLSLLLPTFAFASKANMRLTDSQRQFILYMLPNIDKANAQVLANRERLLTLYELHRSGVRLSASDQRWLHNIADRYNVADFNIRQATSWRLLRQRVDIIPASLALAQAANESAWGSSRFARQGHNYFGLWCYRRGCGMVPKQRAQGKRFEVQVFPNALASVKKYLKTLNTNGAYSKLRHIRHQARINGEPPNPIAMANGLRHYSKHGLLYVKSIQSIIAGYRLAEVVMHSRQA